MYRRPKGWECIKGSLTSGSLLGWNNRQTKRAKGTAKLAGRVSNAGMGEWS